MTTAKVSVIIPTYNRQLLLKSAIQTVLNQTFQDFEIIVVDDASHDSTREFLHSFADKRLRYIRHDYNKGEAASRNTGISNAFGEFIAFLDDDDEWLPEKLELQIDLLNKTVPKVGVAYTGFHSVNLTDKRILSQKSPQKRGDILKDMLIENVVGTPSTVLIRRSCIEKVGLFDENLPYCVDYDFFLRLSKHFHFDYVARTLVYYQVHEGRLSNNDQIVTRGLEKLMQKYSGENGFGELSGTFYSKAYSNIGISKCNYGYLEEGRKILIRSIKYNIFEWKSYVYIIFSLFGNNFDKIIYIKNKILKKINTILNI